MSSVPGSRRFLAAARPEDAGKALAARHGPASERPAAYAELTPKNAELFKVGVNISEKKDPLPGALPQEQIHEKEKLAGFSIDEPSKAG